MLFCVIKLGFCTFLRDEAKDYLKKVVEPYEKGKRLLFILLAIKLYVILKTTLYNRIYGCQNQALYSITKQKLTLKKKNLIKSWVLDIQT